MDKLVAQYAAQKWPDAKLEELGAFFKVEGFSMDEELAQTIGAEIHAKITEHLGKLKEAYGEDLN